MIYRVCSRAFLVLLNAVFLTSCGGGDNTDDAGPNYDRDGVVETASFQATQARINPISDVDVYSFTVEQSNILVEVKVAGKIPASSVQLSLRCQRELSDGSYEDVLGVHSSESGRLRQELVIPLVNEQAGTNYRCYVRDFKDDQQQEILNEGLEDIYSFVWAPAGPAVDPDGSKQTAAALTPNDSESCYVGSIERRYDQDWLKLELQESGVYQFMIEWNPADIVTVTPQARLLDDAGEIVNTALLEERSAKTYVLQELLSAGDHYLTISGTSFSNTDLSSTYRVCVNSIESSELNTNDTQADATEVVVGEEITGALDYSEDVDFYKMMELQEGELVSILLKSGETDCRPIYGLAVFNEAGETIFTDTYFAGETARTVQFRVPSDGDYSIRVSEVVAGGCFSPVEGGGASSRTYSLSLDTMPIDSVDVGESTSTCDAPLRLNEGDHEINGKISYSGDTDCYRLFIDDYGSGNDQYRVLVAELATERSYIDYDFRVESGNEIDLRRRDFDQSDNRNFWRKAFLIKPQNATRLVNISVRDLGADESDLNAGYTLRLRWHRLEDSGYTPSPSAEGLADIMSFTYFDENDEQKGLADSALFAKRVSVVGRDHYPHDSCLSFDNMSVSQTPEVTEEVEGETVVVQPEITVFTPNQWCAGHIDYSGDFDLYELNFRDHFSAGIVEQEVYSISLLSESDVVPGFEALPQPLLPPTETEPTVVIRKLPDLTQGMSALFGDDAQYQVRIFDTVGSNYKEYTVSNVEPVDPLNPTPAEALSSVLGNEFSEAMMTPKTIVDDPELVTAIFEGLAHTTGEGVTANDYKSVLYGATDDIPDATEPMPPIPRFPLLNSVAESEEIFIRSLPNTLTDDLIEHYGEGAVYALRFLEADGDWTDYSLRIVEGEYIARRLTQNGDVTENTLSDGSSLVDEIDLRFAGTSGLLETEFASRLVDGFEHRTPKSLVDPFVCKFRGRLRSSGSYNEYGVMFHALDDAERRIGRISNKCSDCFGDLDGERDRTENGAVDETLEHKDVNGSENGRGFFTEVPQNRSDRIGVLRVFDEREQPDSDGGFYDAPYYFEFGMKCQYK